MKSYVALWAIMPISAIAAFLNTPVLHSSLTARSPQNPASLDANCGARSDVNATCLTSGFGNCCSEKGFCGSTSAYCYEGCQPAFGTCAFSEGKQVISTSGSCGSTSTSNITCLGSSFGDCCSSLGYCGGNSSYCGDGCQGGFGACGLDTEESTTSPTRLPTSTASKPSSTPSDPTTTGSSQSVKDLTPSPDKSGMSSGAKAGVIIGPSIVGVAIIGFIVWFVLRRRRRNRTPDEMANKEGNYGEFYDPKSTSTLNNSPDQNVAVAYKHGDQRHVYEMDDGIKSSQPAELAATRAEMSKLEKEKEKERIARVDDRAAAGYDGAYRGN